MFRYLFARRTDWTVFVVACSLSLTLMLLGPRGQARAAWFLQHTLLAPVELVVGWVNQGVAVYWENQKLRARVAELQIALDGSRVERTENGRLRALLQLRQRHPYHLVPASIAGRSLDRLGGSITLDKGAADGVEANRAILTPDGLVGRIERTTQHAARVLTLLHRECAVAAKIERTRVDGVVRWEFGDRPSLDLLYVSSQEDVKEGDRVVTSGLGGIFPAGIRIGTVEKVGLEPNGLMKEIVVRPAVNFRAMEEVLVYTPGAASGPAPPDLTLENPDDPAAPRVVPDSLGNAPVPAGARAAAAPAPIRARGSQAAAPGSAAPAPATGAPAPSAAPAETTHADTVP